MKVIKMIIFEKEIKLDEPKWKNVKLKKKNEKNTNLMVWSVIYSIKDLLSFFFFFFLSPHPPFFMEYFCHSYM